MATTTLLLNGFSIIGDPHVNSNAAHGGNLMIHDGTAIWDYNDIIVVTVENATDEGVLTGASVITGITVYDSASDYYNDVAKFNYGGAIGIDTGRNNMGDRYLRLDASGLKSSDPGAPVLGELAAVAGVDILGTLDSQKGPFVIPTIEDIDIDGDGLIAGLENGDAAFSSNLNDMIPICFARGTLIETPTGPCFIETLREGDLVNTLDDGPQPIRWIGRKRMAGTGPGAPVRIARGALGNIRDLWVSQNHRMLVRGAAAELLFGQEEVLVAAKHLVDGENIVIEARSQVDYVHFLLDAHQVVFAEGCASESLYPGQQSLGSVDAAERDEILAHFPEIADRGAAFPLSRYELRRYEAELLRECA